VNSLYVTTSKIEKKKRKELEEFVKNLAKKKKWIFERRGKKSIKDICERALKLGEKNVLIFSKINDKIVFRRLKVKPYSYRWKTKKLMSKDL
jgi:rRNA maturation protein Rpf1